MFRKFSSISPWKFGNTEPLLPLSPITYEPALRAKTMLSEGFLFAFQSIVEALVSADRHILEGCLEPQLYRCIMDYLRDLKASDSSILAYEYATPRVEVFNFRLFSGVEIRRRHNTVKDPIQYTGQQLSTSEVTQATGLEFHWEDVEKQGKNTIVYAHPDAPVNLVIAFDTVFHLNSPIGLSNNQASPNKTQEMHIFRFESSPVRFATQLEHRTIQAINPFRLIQAFGEEIFNQEWCVTDIDYALSGNQYFETLDKPI